METVASLLSSPLQGWRKRVKRIAHNERNVLVPKRSSRLVAAAQAIVTVLFRQHGVLLLLPIWQRPRTEEAVVVEGLLAGRSREDDLAVHGS